MNIQGTHIKNIFLLGIIFLFSCQNEIRNIENNVSDGERFLIDFTLKNRASTAEDVISTVRTIVIDGKGEIIANKIVEHSTVADITTISVDVERGKNSIYIFCNETDDLKTELSAITQESDIEKVKFNCIGITSPPLYVKEKDIEVTANRDGSNVLANGLSTLELKVGYLNSKIGMTVIKDVSSGVSDFSIKKLSYKICRVPKYNLIGEGIAYPAAAGWAEEIEVLGEGSIDISSNGNYIINDDTYTVPPGLDSIKVPTVYIPEHILTNQENNNECTYLLITADCETEYGSVISTKYRVNLGQSPPANHNIERGVNYQIYATIRNLGATGLYAEIIPVTEYDLPITWKPFEGYSIVSELRSNYGDNSNIWNNYSQYSGILTIIKNKVASKALFRYGSVVAVTAPTTAGEFDVATDLLWAPEVTRNATTIDSWDKIGYLSTGDVSTAHNLDNIKLGKGDPCRLVGLSESEIASGKIDNELWRMPTDAEMKWLINARNTITHDTLGLYSFSLLLTPFTGYRSETGAMNATNSTEGYYWSSSANKAFIFKNDYTQSVIDDNSAKAYAIRCIRTDIPESLFDFYTFRVEYYGGENYTQMINNSSIFVPHWTYKLKNIADTSMVKISGKQELSNKEVSGLIKVKPLENPYVSKTYEIVGTGYGLDGRVHEKTKNIVQSGLEHRVKIQFTSEPELQLIDGYYRIPKSGAKISFTMTIDPEPYTTIYPDFNDKLLWRIRNIYHTGKLNTVYGSSVVRAGTSVVEIKENTWGHTLGHEFKMVPVEELTYPPHRSEELIFIQDK